MTKTFVKYYTILIIFSSEFFQVGQFDSQQQGLGHFQLFIILLLGQNTIEFSHI